MNRQVISDPQWLYSSWTSHWYGNILTPFWTELSHMWRDKSFTPIWSVSWMSWLLKANCSGKKEVKSWGMSWWAWGTPEECTLLLDTLSHWPVGNCLSALPALCVFSIYGEHIRHPTLSFDLDYESLLSVSTQGVTAVGNTELEIATFPFNPFLPTPLTAVFPLHHDTLNHLQCAL